MVEFSHVFEILDSDWSCHPGTTITTLIHISPVVEMRLHEQDEVDKWGAPGSFSLSLNIFCFNFLQIFHYAKVVGNWFTEMVFFV